MSSIEDFIAIVEERGVRYALLGALAVSAIRPFRTTHDVDVAVDPADLWKLKQGLSSLGYVLVENPRLGKLEFKHREKGDIDVYTNEISGLSVRLLLDRSVEAELYGRKVRVISPEDVLLLKALARRERDLADIAVILMEVGDELEWDYLKRMGRELGLDLRDILRRSIERIPISVDNPPKVRKKLRRLVGDALG